MEIRSPTQTGLRAVLALLAVVVVHVSCAEQENDRAMIRGGGWQGGQQGWWQGGGGGGGAGRNGPEAMDSIHKLMDNHQLIDRSWEKDEATGIITTITTSKDAQVATWIQEHVEIMLERVENQQPIRMWDPLFVQLWEHAQEILATPEPLKNGMLVTLDGTTACGESLAELHAKAVSHFAAVGWDAMDEPHDPSDKCD